MKGIDRRQLLWILALLLVPFVVGAVVYGFLSMGLFDHLAATKWRSSVTAFFVALGVVLVVIVAGWIRAKRREGGLEAGLAVGGGLGGGGGKGEIEALRKNWKESVAKLKATAVSGGGRRALSALPWYVIIGPPGGGKSTLLRGSGIDFPVGDAAIRGMQGTRNCDWWFSNVGIFLDTAGRYISDESAQEWGQFLELVRKHRLRSPINGVIVAVPATTLVEGGEAAQDLDARRIRARLDELIDHLGINFPVWVVLTKVDLVGGFVEFFSQSDPATRRQMMGWTLPPAEGGRFRVQDFETRWETMIRKLREVRPAMVAAAKLRDRAAAYGFPDEMAALGSPLARMLQTMFAPNVYQETPLLRGVYVTSATQQGTPLQKAAARVREMLGAPQVDADAEAMSVKHAYFVTDLMHERILPDQAMTWTTQTEIDRGRLRRIGIDLIGASGAVLLAFFALAVARQGNVRVESTAEAIRKAEANESLSGVERVEALRQAWEEFPQAPGFLGFLGFLGGSDRTRLEVRRREVRRYGASVLEAPKKFLAESVKGLPREEPPTAAQVEAVLAAWRDFEEGATVLRAVAAEVEAERAKGRVPPGSEADILAVPQVLDTEPGVPPRIDVRSAAAATGGSKLAEPTIRYAQEAADLARLLKLRWRADPARVAVFDRLHEIPALKETGVPPAQDLQKSARIALAVWRNHEWSKGSAAFGEDLRDAAKEALSRWAAEQENRVKTVQDLETQRREVLQVGLEELRTTTNAFARFAQSPADSVDRLRDAIDAVVRTCGDERFTRAVAGGGDADLPDWKGSRRLRDALASMVKEVPAAAAAVDAGPAGGRIAEWLKLAPAESGADGKPAPDGRTSASEVEKIRALVKTLGDDLRKWSEGLRKDVPPTVGRTSTVSHAAKEIAVEAGAKAALFAGYADPLKTIPGEWPLADMRTAAQTLAHASQVEGFLASTATNGYAQIAARTKLGGEVPHGAADLQAALSDLLSLLPKEGQAPLPDDVTKSAVEAAEKAFGPLVAAVEGEWSGRLLDSMTALRSGDYRVFLLQFDTGADTGTRLRNLTTLFETKWAGGPPADETARGIWTKAVRFPEEYLLLRRDKLLRLWADVRDFANAPPGFDDRTYDDTVGKIRTAFGRTLDLPSGAPGEKQRLDEVRAAYKDAENAAAEGIARFLNDLWFPVRSVTIRGRKGEKVSETDQALRTRFRQRLMLAFPGRGTSCGPLRLKPGVWEALETTKEDQVAEDREKPIQVYVTLLQSKLESSHPYLLVRYSEQGAPQPQQIRWSPSDTTKTKTFVWIPARALRFDLYRVSETGSEDPYFGAAKQGCVIELVDQATGIGPAQGEYTFAKGENVVRLRVTFDDPKRAEAMRTPVVRTGGEPPEQCVEVVQTGR